MNLKREDCVDSTRSVNNYHIYHEDYNCFAVCHVVKPVDAFDAFRRFCTRCFGQDHFVRLVHIRTFYEVLIYVLDTKPMS